MSGFRLNFCLRGHRWEKATASGGRARVDLYLSLGAYMCACSCQWKVSGKMRLHHVISYLSVTELQ